MKTLNVLKAEDFPDVSVGPAGPLKRVYATEGNFRRLLQKYNELVEAVNYLIITERQGKE